MERLHGAPLTDLAAIRGVTAQDPERILINALNTWFGSVLACPSFHADVHAGAPGFFFIRADRSGRILRVWHHQAALECLLWDAPSSCSGHCLQVLRLRMPLFHLDAALQSQLPNISAGIR